jgi:hypothetical protein
MSDIEGQNKDVKKKNKKRGGMKVSTRIWHDTFELVGIIFILIAVLIVGAVITLQKNSVSLNFLKPMIEENVSSDQSKLYVTIGDLSLSWPDITEPIILQANNIELRKSQDTPFFSINRSDVRLNLFDLLRGQISLSSLKLYDPSLRLIHLGDYKFIVSFADEAYEIPQINETDSEKTIEQLPPANGVIDAIENPDIADIDVPEVPASANTQTALSKLITGLVKNPASLPPAYQKLEEISMYDATVQVTDFDTGRTLKAGDVDADLKRYNGQITSFIKATLPQDYGTKDSDKRPILETLIEYDPEQNKSLITSSVKGVNISTALHDWANLESLDGIDFAMNAKITAHLRGFERLNKLDFDITSDEVFVDSQEFTLLDLPENLEKLALRGHYESENTLSHHITIENFALDGFKSNAEIVYTKNRDNREGAIDIKTNIPDLKTSLIDQYWPTPAADKEKPTAYKWLVERIEGGKFKDVTASLRFNGTPIASDTAPDKNIIQQYDWALDMDSITANFSYEDLKVTYEDDLTPATQIAGSGAFGKQSMTLNIDTAKIGELSVASGGTLVFEDFLAKGRGDATITLDVNGTLKSVFTYLSDEPIRLKERADIDLENVQGNTSNHVVIKFPTIKELKTEQIDINVSSLIKDAILPNVIGSLNLSGGPFNVEASMNDFTFSGKGMLGAAPIDLKWHQYVDTDNPHPYQRRLQAVLVTTDDVKEALDLDLSAFTDAPVRVEIDQKRLTDKESTLLVDADITDVPFFIKPLQYEKKPQEEGQLQFSAKMENDKVVHITHFSLTGPALEIKANDLLFEPGAYIPYGGSVTEFIVGQSSAQIEWMPEFEPVTALNIQADALNIAGFMNTDKAGLGTSLPPLHIEIRAKQLLMKNNENITDAKVLFKQSKEGDIQHLSLTGHTNGAALEVFFRPDEPDNPDRLSFQALDAGRALRAFGLFKTMQGGEIRLKAKGIADAPPQEVRGALVISNFKIVDTPFIATLLNSMTVEGLFSMFQQSGLNFDQLRAFIRTKKNEKGEWEVYFADGKTRGGTLGLTFEGGTNVDQKTLDVKGQIIPASGLNKALSEIPVLGTILSGGEDSIFAANYSIKGKDDNAKVTINPLSAITPGFLRKFLFDNNGDNAATPTPEERKALEE